MAKIVSILLFLGLLFSAVSSSIYALADQMQNPLSASLSAHASNSAQEKQTEYTLPYPGLLPDSPFYFLKVFRDRIIDLAVSDPLKKAEFTLLQADKRLSAAFILSEKREIALAESTESKATNYLERTVDLITQAKKAGDNTLNFEAKLESSLIKHEEEVQDFIAKTDGSTKDGFSKTLERIRIQQMKLKSLQKTS